MERKEFLKTMCQTCICAGVAMLASGSQTPGIAEETKKEEPWEMKKMKTWVANVVQEMDNQLDEQMIAKILESCGRNCASEYLEKLSKFKNDLKGFLEYLNKEWKIKTQYKPDIGEILFTGSPQEECPCPMGKNPPMTSGSFCNCSNGWMKQIFEFVSGKTVDVELTQSVLRGNERCEWKVILS